MVKLLPEIVTRDVNAVLSGSSQTTLWVNASIPAIDGYRPISAVVVRHPTNVIPWVAFASDSSFTVVALYDASALNGQVTVRVAYRKA